MMHHANVRRKKLCIMVLCMAYVVCIQFHVKVNEVQLQCILVSPTPHLILLNNKGDTLQAYIEIHVGLKGRKH